MHTAETRVRFWAKVERGEGCWEWVAGRTGRGYGAFWIDGKQYLAHRIAYELEVGPIPKGMTLDHLCRNRACVRPDHLEVVSRGENVLRGEGLTAVNARKTHCPRGHEYDLISGGRRRCRTCAHDRYLKKRASQ